MKWLRYFLMLCGAAITIFGAVQDYDLITIAGVFLFVIGLMLKSIIEIFTGRKPK